MALLLLIDTSGTPGSVALALNGEILALRQNDSERDHAATLNAMVAGVLAETGKGLADLDGIDVCNGPGSYTGLRIGLAAAKAYCYVLDKPLQLQNKLLLLARQHLGAHPQVTLAVAILAARAGEYFAAAVNGAGEVVLEPAHFFAADLQRFLGNHSAAQLLLITDLGEKLPELIQIQAESVYTAIVAMPFWARLSNAELGVKDPVALHLAEPFYLKSAYTISKKK